MMWRRQFTNICTKSRWGLFLVESRALSKFCGNLFGSFCVILITNQPADKQTDKGKSTTTQRLRFKTLLLVHLFSPVSPSMHLFSPFDFTDKDKHVGSFLKWKNDLGDKPVPVKVSKCVARKYAGHPHQKNHHTGGLWKQLIRTHIYMSC